MARDDDKEERSPVEIDQARIERMADRLKIPKRDREQYIHEHMTGLGYKAQRTYKENDDDDDGGGRYRVRRNRRNRDDDDDDL